MKTFRYNTVKGDNGRFLVTALSEFGFGVGDTEHEALNKCLYNIRFASEIKRNEKKIIVTDDYQYTNKVLLTKDSNN